MSKNPVSSSASNSFLQDFIQKITLVPNDVNRFLRLIRFLDKRLEKLQKVLMKQQKDILQKINGLKDKDKKSLSVAMEGVVMENNNFSDIITKKVVPPSSLPSSLHEIFNEYINMIIMEKQVIGYARQKSAIGVQLTVQVRQYFQMLQKYTIKNIALTQAIINFNPTLINAITGFNNYNKEKKADVFNIYKPSYAKKIRFLI